MPTSLHPQAKFDPIPPDLDLDALVDRTANFKWAARISAARVRNLGQHEFEKLVVFHVINGGRPLVIEKWNDRLPPALFSAKWLQDTYDKKQEDVWDITAQTNIPMTTGHYLRSMKHLAAQWTPANFRDDRRQRLYLKDIDCPPEWRDHLRKVLPPNVFYLNENVETKTRNQPDADAMFYDDDDDAVVAPAGDLMSSLPDHMRAQNLMCYIGHEGTYTPAHREMCASLGQNIMVEASGDTGTEQPGSSIWFMTESKDREVVREYFLSMLGHDVEIENHFAQINAWKKATFPVYMVEQKVGDFILVPPLAPHQVWNRGTRTIKVAWNRTTVETLELALHQALPKARLVCRDEQYKNKAIIYYTLQKYYADLQRVDEAAKLTVLGLGRDHLIRGSVRISQMARDFEKLFDLFTEVLVDEMFSSREKYVEHVPFDSNITCSYCRANIFNRFLTCKHCVRALADGDEDTYDVCMECYVMGRSCLCVSGLTWCEQWPWADLVDSYENWRAMVIKNHGLVDPDNSPPPLEVARIKAGKKSAAQICQEQLRRRPFKDVTKPSTGGASDLEPEPSEPEVDDEGRVKKKRRKKKGDVQACHVCRGRDFKYKMAFCAKASCNEAYCFGTLYRGFDLMPQAVMEQDEWACPKCTKICNCGACRRAGHTDPYIPKITLLGHDTRRVADDRSIEVLVDFRLPNLGWLKNMGEEGRSQHTKRMQLLREQADAEKAKDGQLQGVIEHIVVAAAADAQQQQDQEQQQRLPLLHPAPVNTYTNGDHEIPAEEQRPHSAAAAAAYPHLQDQDQVGGGDLVPEEANMFSSRRPGQMPLQYPSLYSPTAYPDPSMMGGDRMLGRGYYQQDNSPDRILFDPYLQTTEEEEMAARQEQLEFVKKTLRASRRRAGADDPDFLDPDGGEGTGVVDVMDLDPALLAVDTAVQSREPAGESSGGSSSSSAGGAVPGIDAAEQKSHGDATELDGDTGQLPKPNPPLSSRNGAKVPQLRQRPRTSYREMGDDPDEFNERVQTRETASRGPADAPSETGADALPAAAPARQEGSQPPTPATASALPRKRGRPRKSEAPAADPSPTRRAKEQGRGAP